MRVVERRSLLPAPPLPSLESGQRHPLTWRFQPAGALALCSPSFMPIPEMRVREGGRLGPERRAERDRPCGLASHSSLLPEGTPNGPTDQVLGVLCWRVLKPAALPGASVSWERGRNAKAGFLRASSGIFLNPLCPVPWS